MWQMLSKFRPWRNSALKIGALGTATCLGLCGVGWGEDDSVRAIPPGSLTTLRPEADGTNASNAPVPIAYEASSSTPQIVSGGESASIAPQTDNAVDKKRTRMLFKALGIREKRPQGFVATWQAEGQGASSIASPADTPFMPVPSSATSSLAISETPVSPLVASSASSADSGATPMNFVPASEPKGTPTVQTPPTTIRQVEFVANPPDAVKNVNDFPVANAATPPAEVAPEPVANIPNLGKNSVARKPFIDSVFEQPTSPSDLAPPAPPVMQAARDVVAPRYTTTITPVEPKTPETSIASSKLISLQPPAPAPVPADPKAPPFEVIDEAGAITVTVRRSKMLHTKFDIYRTAVVDPGICDIVQFSPRELSIIGRGIGSTHMTFWFEGGARPHTYLVTVEADEQVKRVVEQEYQKLEDIVAELFPDSKVRLTVMADKLIVRGQAKDSEEAARILAIIRNQGNGGAGGAGLGGFGGIGAGAAARVLSDWEAGQTSNNRPQLQLVNMLQVPGVQQVSLRVKIAEVNRTAARGFGVDLGGHINFTNNPKGSQLFLQSLLGLAAGTGSGQSLLAQFDGDDIQIGIRYLQQHGVIRLLSEPTLVTMSGTPATFVAGGEFAVPTVVGSAGLNAVTTDFRSFGAIVSFMPTVIDKDRIRLQVSPEFSQVNAALTVGGTPGLNTRSVNTTVEMREGQTLAIAGLLEDNIKNSSRGNMPFLYPWIGQRDSSRNETELLILVTPELIHPMDPEEVPPLPGFDMTEPDNWQFFIGAKLEGNPTRDFRSTVWPRLRQRYNAGGTSMISGPFGHGR